MAAHFETDLFRLLNTQGLVTADDELRPLAALIGAAADAVLRCWLERLRAHAGTGPDPLLALGSFGEEWLRPTGNPLPALNVLAAAHSELAPESFAAVVALGLATVKYADFQASEACIPITDAGEFDAFFRECVLVVGQLCLNNQQNQANLESYLADLTPERFVGAVQAELDAQANGLGIGVSAG